MPAPLDKFLYLTGQANPERVTAKALKRGDKGSSSPDN